MASRFTTPLTAYARRVFLVVAIAILAFLIWRLSSVFLLLFGAIITATLLTAMATPMEKHFHWSSRFSVVVSVIFLIVLIVLGSWLIGDRLVDQIDRIRLRLPKAQEALMAWINSHPLGISILEVWEDTKKDSSVPWAGITNVATLTISAIGSAGLMVVVGIYLAADPKLYRKGFVRLIPPMYRDQIDDALVATGHALSRWLLGQYISMLFVGSATAIGLAVLGMPLALSIGVIAGLLAFIPFFGPIASGILAVMLAFMDGPDKALYVAILCIVIQQIEGNILMPFVQRWAVELPPVLGITAAVIFGLLFGLAGIIFATPLMVVVMVLVQKLYVEEVLEDSPNLIESHIKT
ncbi:MAG: AI-2E family transporter [Pseudomonadota bacterium]